MTATLMTISRISRLYVFLLRSPCTTQSSLTFDIKVFDTTFCGDWAGAVFSSSQTCSALASSCEDYVRNNPSAFADAYWLINSLKVYQSNGTPARLAHASSSILLEKNQTLPLGTQIPVAMGGGSPASNTRRGRRSAWGLTQ